MILLLMAAVGIALAIFRWPWVETDFAYQSKETPSNPNEGPLAEPTYFRYYQ
jgi:hypothetical protein